MHERLSFYIQRDSALHRLNPLTKLTLTFTLILVGFLAPWYWTATTLIVAVIVPLSFWGRAQREYLGAVGKLLIPVVGVLFLMQSFFSPLDKHIVFNLWVLDVSTESLRFAFQSATRIFVMISAFILFLLSTHPSELMSDLTHRGLPGQFAYVLIATLQIIPQMQAKAQTIIAAQRSRGMDTQGSFAARVGSLVPLVGPLVFGSLVEVEERAIAIEARGFTSAHTKTSLREIPDTAFDKSARWVLVMLMLAAFVSRLWLL